MESQDLKIRAYKYSIRIIKFLEDFPNKKTYWILRDQLLKAATSIGANIVEAKSSSSKKEFIHFYEIALKSANETKYWLGLLRDATEIDKEKIEPLLKETQELSNIIASSLITMKKKNQF
jgi:four helix bundle protein